MTWTHRVNDWLVRYPLTFAVIVMAFAVAVIAVGLTVTTYVQGGRIDDNTLRLDHIENQQCLDARYKFAQTTFIDALIKRDPVAIEAATADYRARSIDLVSNAGGRHITCHIDLAALPGG
jgi:hypothetical protein